MIRYCVLCVWGIAMYALGQTTRIDSGLQVGPRPAVVVLEYSNCVASGPGFDCSGLSYARLKFSDGAVKAFILVPTNASLTPDSKWVAIPVTLPPGPTAVTCAQTKP